MIDNPLNRIRTSLIYSMLAFQLAALFCTNARGMDTAETSIASITKQYTNALKRYYDLYSEMKRNVDVGREPILQASKVVLGEPVVLDPKMIEPVLREKKQFEQLASSLTPPKLANPITDSLSKDLNSPEMAARDAALAKVQSHFKDYEKAIERFEEKRNEASAISSRAAASEQVFMGLERQVGDINNSPLGVALNAATQNRFSWMWGDLSTTVSDAIRGRAGSASSLLSAYDKALENMHDQLASYADVRELTAFYRRQMFMDRYRDPGFKKPNAEVKAANDKALAALQKANSINISSEYGGRLEEIQREVQATIHDTLKTEKELWSRAESANNRQAASHMASTMFAMGAAAANLANASATNAISSSGANTASTSPSPGTPAPAPNNVRIPNSSSQPPLLLVPGSEAKPRWRSVPSNPN